MAAELLRSGLPPPWSYGVMQDGRIFFINEESKSTTWLHPVHNHPVQSGHISLRELPRGWELSHTPEGVPYYIDHMNLRTSFIHPITGESDLPVHEGNLTPTSEPNKNFKRASLRRKSNKQKLIDKTPTAKRTQDAPVAIKGWLYKQEGRSWKKRWFVLSDFCLYFYKGSEEGQTVGSLLLPSYTIDFCTKEDGVNKKYAFKAEHQNMRTAYFATDTQDDQARWMKALTLATVLQKDAHADPDQGYSTGGFDQSHQRLSNENRDQWSDIREDTHPKALESSGYSHPQDRSYSPHFNREDLETPPPIPKDRNYSPDLESTRISQVSSHRNLTGEDTGGFGEPRDRISLRDRSSGGRESWGQRHSVNEGTPQGPSPADPDTAGFVDPNRPDNKLSSASQESKENSEDMSAQVSRRHGYGHDPSMRASLDSNGFQQQQNMRNSYTGPNTRYPDNRSVDPRHSMPPGLHYPDNRRDASFRDPRGYPVDARIAPSGGGYRNTDRDSLSSRGSRTVQPPRDHNYNMSKGAAPGEHPQNYPGNRTSNGYNSSALEQSTDSMEKTLDRSFDNSRQLPGYDSFRKERPDASIYRQKDGPRGDNRAASLTDVQRNDSLRHLQEWTKTQIHRGPQSRPSSSYSNASDRPLSDGRRVYSSSNPPSERSSVRGVPLMDQAKDGPSNTYRSPPPEPLKLNVSAAQSYSRSNQEPVAVSTAGAPDDDSPQRPPIPAALREQYIQDLADTKTPHTRNDLLSNIQIQRMRQAEPLVFQYPEVSPAKETKVSEEKKSQNELEAEDRERYLAKTENRSRAPPREGGPSFVGSPRPTHQQLNMPKHDIQTIKEDPNMPDKDTLTTKTLADLQKHLSGHRLRLSIAAGDLGEKSHEELVLLLIQLRRDQSRLEQTRDHYRNRLDTGRPQEKDYKIKRKNSIGRLNDVVEREHDEYLELRKMYDEIENQLEVTKPLVSLLDNMVRMGSLYGGNNLMLASQYKQHKLGPGEYTPPKKMIVFSRQYQEEKLSKEQEEELKQLMADEVDLEDKLQQLYRLDRDLQEKSLAVMNLQDNKDRLEKVVIQVRKDIQMTEDTRNAQHLKNQLRHQEAELGALRQQLAESSKVLEEISAEDAKVENEVMLLRKKIYGVNRSQNSPTALGGENTRARQKLEEELQGIQSIMVGMSKQQSQLSDTIKALRHSTPDLSGAATEKNDKAYMETDMDSGRSRDLSKEADHGYRSGPYGNKQQTVVRETRESVTMTARDRSKSAPPPVEREMPVQERPKMETAQLVGQARREESSSGSLPQGRPTQDRTSVRSSIDGQYNSMSRASTGPSHPQQATYQKVITRETRQSGVNQSPEGSTSRNNSQGHHQEGLYRAEMRMVTPEPREEHRYKTDPRLNSPAPSTGSSTQHRKLDSYQNQGHRYASQVGVKVMLSKKVKGDGNQRVSEYIDSLNTPEAEEQRSFDILEDSQASNGSVYGGMVEAVAVAREGAGGILHDPNANSNSSKDLNIIVAKSVAETGKHGVAKSVEEEIVPQKAVVTGGSERVITDYEKSLQRGVVEQQTSVKVSITGGSNKIMNDYEKTLLGEQVPMEKAQSIQEIATGEATSKKVVSDYEKRLLLEQHEKSGYSHSTDGTSGVPLDEEAERELDKRLQGPPSIQRTDSRSKRLTSNLAMSLLEGKEQVIRESLKRVASDASDYSAKRGSIKPYQSYAPLAEYLATLSSSSRAKYEMELKDLEADHSGSKDTGEQTVIFNLFSDNPSTTNTVEVAQSVTVTGGSVPMSHYVLGMKGTTHEHSPNPLVAPGTNLNSAVTIEKAHTGSSAHIEGQGRISQTEAVVLQEQSLSYNGQTYASKPMSEVRPQQQQPQQLPQQEPQSQQQPLQQPQDIYRVEEQTLSMNGQGYPGTQQQYQGDKQTDGQVYEPLELSEADDNTKKFFGLLPKDAARTVRDVKKKESERRSRERKRFYVNVHGPADMSEAQAMEKTQEFHRTQSLPRRVSAPVYNTPQLGTHDDSVLKRKSVGIIPAKKAQQLENRRSASDRLFGNVRSSTAPAQRSQAEHGRQTPDLFTPRPFSNKAGEATQRSGSMSRLTGGATTVAKVSPYNNRRDTWDNSRRDTRDNSRRDTRDNSRRDTWGNTREITTKTRSLEITKGGSTGRQRVASSLENLDHKALDEEERKVRQYWADRLQQRHVPRGRYMTISSAQPAKMEQSPQPGWKPTKVHSAAGDLISGRWNDNIPDVIRSEPLKDLTIDDTTIDREVLFIPDKVEIPERYVPDSEMTVETEEDRMRRLEKTSQIKRMLAAQSLADWQEEEALAHGRYPQRQLETEMQRREQLLDLKQELAIQVTQRSKEVAENYNLDQLHGSDSGGSGHLPKSELSLFLLGRDGRGYIPSLPPHIRSQQEENMSDAFSDAFQ